MSCILPSIVEEGLQGLKEIIQNEKNAQNRGERNLIGQNYITAADKILEISAMNKEAGQSVMTNLLDLAESAGIRIRESTYKNNADFMLSIITSAIGNNSTSRQAEEKINEQLDKLIKENKTVVGKGRKKVALISFISGKEYISSKKEDKEKVQSFTQVVGSPNTLTIFGGNMDKTEDTKLSGFLRGKEAKPEENLSKRKGGITVGINFIRKNWKEEGSQERAQNIAEAKKNIDDAIQQIQEITNATNNGISGINLPQELQAVPTEVATYLQQKLQKCGIYYKLEETSRGFAKLISSMQTHGQRMPKDAKLSPVYVRAVQAAQKLSAKVAEDVKAIKEGDLNIISTTFQDPTQEMQVHNWMSRGFSSVLDTLIFKKIQEIRAKQKQNEELEEIEEKLLLAWSSNDKQLLHQVALTSRTPLFKKGALFPKDGEEGYYSTTVHAVIGEMHKIITLAASASPATDAGGNPMKDAKGNIIMVEGQPLYDYIKEEFKKYQDLKRRNTYHPYAFLWFVDDALAKVASIPKSDNRNEQFRSWLNRCILNLNSVCKKLDNPDIGEDLKAALWKQIAYDLYFKENIGIQTVMKKAVKNEDVNYAEQDDLAKTKKSLNEDSSGIINEDDTAEQLNKSGDFYLIKGREVDPEDSLSAQIKLIFARLYNKDKDGYTFDDLGGREELSPSLVFGCLIDHFANTRDEKEFDFKVQTAREKYPWFEPVADQLDPHSSSFDENLRNLFYRGLNKTRIRAIMITATGIVAEINSAISAQNLVREIETNYTGGLIQTEYLEDSLYDSSGKFNKDGFDKWHSRAVGNMTGKAWPTIAQAEQRLNRVIRLYDAAKENKNLEETINYRREVLQTFETLRNPIRGKNRKKPFLLEWLSSLGINTNNIDINTLVPRVPEEGSEEREAIINSQEAFEAYIPNKEKLEDIHKLIILLKSILRTGDIDKVRKLGLAGAFDTTIAAIASAIKYSNIVNKGVSYRIGDRTQQSYQGKGFVDRLRENIHLDTSYSNKDIEYGDKFISEEYGNFDFFKNNPFVMRLKGYPLGSNQEMDEPNIDLMLETRQMFDVAHLFALGSNEERDAFERITSDKLIWYSVLAFFAADKKSYKFSRAGWYRSSLFSDSGRQVMYRMPRYVIEERGLRKPDIKVIIDNLTNLAFRELDRILEEDAPLNGEVENYEKNKHNFCFLPCLNAEKEDLVNAYKTYKKEESASEKLKKYKIVEDRIKELLREYLQKEFIQFRNRFLQAATNLKREDVNSIAEALETVINRADRDRQATTDVNSLQEYLDKELEEQEIEDDKDILDSSKNDSNVYYDSFKSYEVNREQNPYSILSPYASNPFVFTDENNNKLQFGTVFQFVMYNRLLAADKTLFLTKEDETQEQAKARALQEILSNTGTDAIYAVLKDNLKQDTLEQFDFTKNKFDYYKQAYKLLIEQNSTIATTIDSLGDSALTAIDSNGKALRNDVYIDALNNIREEDFGQKPTKKKRTNNETIQAVNNYLEDFFYNDYLAQANIIELTGGDLAQYESFVGFIKRNKQAYAAGERGYAADENGNPIMENALFLEDFEVATNTYQGAKKLLTEAANRGDISEGQKNLILGALSSLTDINSTDGYSLRTVKGFRKLLRAMGMLSNKEVVEALDRMEKGTMTGKDLWNILNQIKPFVRTHESQERGNRNVKIIQQRKNSEYVLSAFFGLLNKHFNKSPELEALFKIAEEKDIDVIHFKSVIKVGYHHGIDISHNVEKFAEHLQQLEKNVGKENMPYTNFKEYIQYITNRLDKEEITQEEAAQEYDRFRHERIGTISNSAYTYLSKQIDSDPAFIHVTPLSDVMLVQPSDDHLTDAWAKEGSQLRNIITADLPHSMQLQLDGQEVILNEQEIQYVWNAVHSELMKRGYEHIARIMDDPNAFANYLQNQVSTNKRYNEDVRNGLRVENGEFVTPAIAPTMSNKVNALILSLASKEIQQIKLPGGQAVLTSCVGVSSYGLDDSLHVEYEDEGKTRIKYMECMLPAQFATLIKDYVITKVDEETNEEYYTLDIAAIEDKESGNPDLLKVIGYRIPTEAKYSMVPLKIVGFLPASMGASIMLPSDIVAISGTDFDIDKLFLIFKTATREVFNPGYTVEDMRAKKLAWVEENWDKLRNLNQKQIHRKFKQSPEGKKIYREKPKYKTNSVKLYRGRDFAEQIEEANTDEINNLMWDMIWGILTSPEGSQQVMQSATYIDIKQTSRQQQILENPEVLRAFIEEKCGGNRDLLYDALNRSTFKELDAFIESKTANTDPLSFITYLKKHRNLMDGNALIGVFAVNSSSHYKYQHMTFVYTDENGNKKTIRGIEINENNRFNINERRVFAFDSYIDPNTKYIITQICAQFQAASPDNGKDPTLGDLGINYENASFTCALTRLGFLPQEIGIVNRTEHLANGIGRTLWVRNQNQDKPQKDKVLREFNLDTKRLTGLLAKDTLGEEFTEDDKIYLQNYYLWRQNLDTISEYARMGNSFDRVDSPSAALPTTEAEVGQIKVSAENAWRALSSEDSPLLRMHQLVNIHLVEDVRKANPKLSEAQLLDEIHKEIRKSPCFRVQAAYTYGIELASEKMSKWLPFLHIADKLIRELEYQTNRRFTGKYRAKDVKRLLTAYTRYILSEASIFNNPNMTFQEVRNYYITEFPQKFDTIRKRCINNPQNDLEKKLGKLPYFQRINTSATGIKMHSVGSLPEDVRRNYQRTLEFLLQDYNQNSAEEAKEAKQLAHDLFLYSFFQDGNFFGHSSIGPFFSTLFLSKMGDYIEKLKEYNSEKCADLARRFEDVDKNRRTQGVRASVDSVFTDIVFQYLLNNPTLVAKIDFRDLPKQQKNAIKVDRKDKKIISLTIDASSIESDVLRLFLNKYKTPLRLINFQGSLYYLANDESNGTTYVKLQYVPITTYNRTEKLIRRGNWLDKLMDAVNIGGQSKGTYYDYYDASSLAFDIKAENIKPAGKIYDYNKALEEIRKYMKKAGMALGDKLTDEQLQQLLEIAEDSAYAGVADQAEKANGDLNFTLGNEREMQDQKLDNWLKSINVNEEMGEEQMLKEAELLIAAVSQAVKNIENGSIDIDYNVTPSEQDDDIPNSYLGAVDAANIQEKGEIETPYGDTATRKEQAIVDPTNQLNAAEQSENADPQAVQNANTEDGEKLGEQPEMKNPVC